MTFVYRVRVTYGQPDDPASFDAYYVRTHVPLVDRIPGLREFRAGHGDSVDEATPAAYFHAELVFDTKDDAVRGLSSEQGQVAARDIDKFATGGSSMSFVNDEIVH